MQKMIVSLMLMAILLVACGTTSTPTEEIVATATIEKEEVEIEEEIVVEETSQPEEMENVDEPLSPEEIAGISYVREEEKLARDLCLTMYEQWGLKFFQNIGDSEAAHSDVAKRLIIRYELEDPVGEDEVGLFSNETLRELYKQLIAQGTLSRIDAIKVGAAIEEISILDLEKYLLQTDDSEIQLVYEGLLEGSYGHLHSFVRMFEQQSGEVYQPQHLDLEKFNTVMALEIASGSGGQGQSQGSGQGGQGGGKNSTP